MFKKIALDVEMMKSLWHTDYMRAAYGYNRKEKDFANLNISDGKIWIDNKLTGLEQRMDMLLSIREGVTVVLLSMADLGKGKSQLKAIAAIEATGATIEFQEVAAPKGVMGRPKTVEFASDADLQKALQIWDMLPAKEALALIGKQFDVWPDRNRMNYLKRKHSADT